VRGDLRGGLPDGVIAPPHPGKAGPATQAAPVPCPTVLAMNVVVATAEPRGAYHLTPLADALATSGASFAHLVPYPEPTQGEPVVPVVTDAGVLDRCDRVVVTGGTFSAWTELVARRAVALGKPVVFSELAYVGDAAPITPPVPFLTVTALSDDGASPLERYLSVTAVTITGTPALDGLPAWAPAPKSVLLLSTSDMVERDPDLVLLRTGRALQERGWHVCVRLHPREDPAPWDGFTTVSGQTQAESASTAQVVLGYPGSAHVLAAAVGVPVIALAPTPALAGVLTPRQQAAMSALTTGVDDTLACVEHARVPDRTAVAAVVGPIGGAARRVVDAWIG
jgi:hypothetical protein